MQTQRVQTRTSHIPWEADGCLCQTGMRTLVRMGWNSWGWGGTLPDGVASQILPVENIWSANVLFSGKQKTIGLTSRSKKGQMCCFCCCLTHGMRMPALCPWQVKLPPQKFQCPEETKCVHSITIWPWIHLKPALHVSQFLNDVFKTKSWSYTLSLS